MTRVLPFHSHDIGAEAVYHDQSDCPEGRRIGPEWIRHGEGGLMRCEICAGLRCKATPGAHADDPATHKPEVAPYHRSRALGSTLVIHALPPCCGTATSAPADEPAKPRRFVTRLDQELERRVAQRTAELTETLDAKDAFLANISHELRTPLNSVIGFSGVLSEGLAGELNEEQQRQIDMINASGKQLLELVNRILDLARIRSEAVDRNIARFDVADVVDDVLAAVSPSAELKDLPITLQPANHRVWMRSDPSRVKQILVNLLGNAVKFTECGRVGLRVTEYDGYVIFVVTDTGPGIPRADLEHIFDDFFRGARVGQADPSGTGLGLAVSQRLAESLGGRITVQSTVGTGSTFIVRLPAEASVTAHAAGSAESAQRVQAIAESAESPRAADAS